MKEKCLQISKSYGYIGRMTASKILMTIMLFMTSVLVFATSCDVEDSGMEEEVMPRAIVYLSDDCTIYGRYAENVKRGPSADVLVFTARKSRAFQEFDLPCPVKMGRKLFKMNLESPKGKPQLLFDAGQKGAIGSPSASYDGKWIYMSMVLEGESFYHIYRISSKFTQSEDCYRKFSLLIKFQGCTFW